MSHDFQFKNNELYCEETRVADIANKVGTPFYLYSYKTMVDHFTKIKKAFESVNPLICFAMKSNDNLSVVQTLLNEGAGLDIVSQGELKKALYLKADPNKIVFASVGKTAEEIAFAIKTGILLFNVESEPELQKINRVAKKLNKKTQVAIRVNPDVEAPTHEFITTGTLKKKFGIDLRTAKKLFKSRQRYSHVKINGLHVHIGSQIVKGKPFVFAIQKAIHFLNELKKEEVRIEYLDIGGGLGIIYKDERPQTAQQFADAVLPILENTDYKIIMEPGRFIVGNAGIFVTKVLYIKDNGYKKFVIVDGGMNDLIRPSLYGAYHEIVPVKKRVGARHAVPVQKVDVVGPVCESGDFFAKDRVLPKVSDGELLAVMGAGAYGFTMSSNYNARCRVPEVLVKGRQYYVIRKRESFNDLIKGEVIPKFLR